MSRKDYFTGKKAMSGNKKSHAMNHSRRVWNVNLQTVRITLPNGQTRRVKVSARTLKTLNKKNKFGVKKAVKTPKVKPVVKKVEVTKVEQPKVETKKPVVKKTTKAVKKTTTKTVKKETKTKATK